MKPTLVVMAAGMGSRYGGLKQIDPVGRHGEILMDYSIYDAVRAGFGKVVFIIKPENEAAFREAVGDRLAAMLPVAYAYQTLDRCLPEGFGIPDGRVKPWGTAHAVLCAREAVDAPFAVINADDYYGREAFQKMAAFLSEAQETSPAQYAMVGYELKNTLTENGHVARGVCETAGGRLIDITERTRIERRDGRTQFTEDGEAWTDVDESATVSMNLWGFTPGFFRELDAGFAPFLRQDVAGNPLKAEYFLPFVVDGMIKRGEAAVTVLASADRWYGVTYREDKPVVVAAIESMTAAGLYPEKLWGGEAAL